MTFRYLYICMSLFPRFLSQQNKNLDTFSVLIAHCSCIHFALFSFQANSCWRVWNTFSVLVHWGGPCRSTLIDLLFVYTQTLFACIFVTTFLTCFLFNTLNYFGFKSTIKVLTLITFLLCLIEMISFLIITRVHFIGPCIFCLHG